MRQFSSRTDAQSSRAREDLLVNLTENALVSLPLDIVEETVFAALPTYSLDQIALQLTNGYWDGTDRSFNVSAGGTITVNLTGLTSDSHFFAEAALEAWSMVSGLNFQSITGSADITFGDSDEDGGAYSTHSRSGSRIISSTVEIETDWISDSIGNLNSYSFFTYMHEIGHALGLGHAGHYNGAADFVTDTGDVREADDDLGIVGTNHYRNDSWQMSLMSYISQSENTTVNASKAYTGTPMIADILAIQDLYGVATNLRTGNTTYGENSSAGGYYDSIDFSNMAFTIIDNGGIDTIDFRSETSRMIVDLNAEAISSIGGETGNMIIARDTTIENFNAGSGNDDIYGNASDNLIKGGGGIDFIKGFAGNDILKGNDGADIINGNGKHDKLYGGDGNDILKGGAGADVIFGGNDNDTITGGIGRDKLIGGAGADTFIFRDGDGKDKIRDFQDDTDTIELDAAMWGGGLTVEQVLSTYGSFNVTKGWVELDFGTGDRIIVDGISSVNDLVDDISIV